jgi:hypothetical protein
MEILPIDFLILFCYKKHPNPCFSTGNTMNDKDRTTLQLRFFHLLCWFFFLALFVYCAFLISAIILNYLHYNEHIEINSDTFPFINIYIATVNSLYAQIVSIDSPFGNIMKIWCGVLLISGIMAIGKCLKQRESENFRGRFAGMASAARFPLLVLAIAMPIVILMVSGEDYLGRVITYVSTDKDTPSLKTTFQHVREILVFYTMFSFSAAFSKTLFRYMRQVKSDNFEFD